MNEKLEKNENKKTADVLRAENLVRDYVQYGEDGEKKKEIHVLNGLNFSIQRQEFVGIMGASGSGKTTLSRCSAGTLMKLSSTLGIPMEQLITLTAEKPQMNGGKPADRTYLEKDLPASLDKALREYIQGEKDKVSYMDCLWGELYSAINSNQWSNAITQEQADYLRAKYL